MNQNQSIRHGQVWLDTEGKPIQAHGGSIFFENDTFYWYGENKEKALEACVATANLDDYRTGEYVVMHQKIFTIGRIWEILLNRS